MSVFIFGRIDLKVENEWRVLTRLCGIKITDPSKTTVRSKLKEKRVYSKSQADYLAAILVTFSIIRQSELPSVHSRYTKINKNTFEIEVRYARSQLESLEHRVKLLSTNSLSLFQHLLIRISS